MHFLSLIIGFYLILGTAMTFPTVLSVNYASTVTDEELTQDVDKFNLGIPWFPSGNYYESFNSNYIKPIKYITYGINGKKKYSYTYPSHSENNYDGEYIFNYNNFNENEFYSDNEYQFAWYFPIKTAYNNKKTFLQSKSKEEIIASIQDFIDVNQKYGNPLRVTAEEMFLFYDGIDFKFNFHEVDSINRKLLKLERDVTHEVSDSEYLKWEFYPVESNMENIAEIKMLQIPLFNDDFHVFIFILIFCLSTVIRIFKNMKVRTFIYGILTMILLPIIVALIVQSIGRFDSEIQVLWSFLLLYVFAAVISITTFKAEHYSHFRGICVFLFALTSPFLPVYVLLLTQEMYRQTYQYYYLYRESFEILLPICIYGGLILYFILLQPLFKRIYTRLWALPVK